jgi:hypothetical protein
MFNFKLKGSAGSSLVLKAQENPNSQTTVSSSPQNLVLLAHKKC